MFKHNCWVTMAEWTVWTNLWFHSSRFHHALLDDLYLATIKSNWTGDLNVYDNSANWPGIFSADFSLSFISLVRVQELLQVSVSSFHDLLLETQQVWPLHPISLLHNVWQMPVSSNHFVSSLFMVLSVMRIHPMGRGSKGSWEKSKYLVSIVLISLGAEISRNVQ